LAVDEHASAPPPVDPREDVGRLLHDLRTSRHGLRAREAERRLTTDGANELVRRSGTSRTGALVRQLVHPLALLLWLAAALSVVAGTPVVGAAIVAVIAVNALFAVAQERQAERAVEALASYLPPHATVRRDDRPCSVPVREVVPGDILLIAEGDRVAADARLLHGSLEVDMSELSGESRPVTRAAGRRPDRSGSYLDTPDLVFGGTSCITGEAEAAVFATGMRTELGRIASLAQRVGVPSSPLERQVRRVAWLIGLVAVLIGAAFLPLGTLVARLSVSSAVVFAVGLLVGNVPEGLLPTITLALAGGVRSLARRGALMKRLSSVETLGSTTVICTDKTGTLTENRMAVAEVWPEVWAADAGGASGLADDVRREALAAVATRCSTAELVRADDGQRPSGSSAAVSAADGSPAAEAVGDPTEVALLRLGAALAGELPGGTRQRERRAIFHFDPVRKLMSTVDEIEGVCWVHVKGAPEMVLPRCTTMLAPSGEAFALDDDGREAVTAEVRRLASKGLRVLALARRIADPVPPTREQAEQGLAFVALVALRDPPRHEVGEAIERCHRAGIRVLMVTGDHALTAVAVAKELGIGGADPSVTNGAELDAMSDQELDRVLREGEHVFARVSPEAKLRITASLQAEGEVVAMTGDGVNDAPALQAADIGVAMGRAGTDVAREAATMVLTDDNFATIVAAVEEGRRVYANVRKFIFYIFVHATPEVIPFVAFAVSGGKIPLPLTVLAILAIDLGTETLPALALGREQAEEGIMDRPPRARTEGVIQPSLLLRAWLFLGVITAALALAGFFFVLVRAGWHPGDPVGAHRALHHAYLQASTMTFLGIVACQVGTAYAARTERSSLRSIGVFSNKLLLWGLLFEVLFAAFVVAVPGVDRLFDTAIPPLSALVLLPAFPVIVWGSDEIARAVQRRGARRSTAVPA
jgi:magnesium-transporting ATPase (P-type)